MKKLLQDILQVKIPGFPGCVTLYLSVGMSIFLPKFIDNLFLWNALNLFRIRLPEKNIARRHQGILKK